MKYSIILPVFGILAATASAVATPAAAPAAVAEPLRWRWNYCWLPGMPCIGKMKRSLDQHHAHIADHHAQEGGHKFDAFTEYYCSQPSKPCYHAKRSADALAGALAEAHALADPSAEPLKWRWNYCWLPGMPCIEKMKRSVEELDQSLADFYEGNADDFATATDEEKAEFFKLAAAIVKIKEATADVKANVPDA